MNALQAVRYITGPLAVSSGHRCEDHNRKVGGATYSRHLHFATDLHSPYFQPDRLAEVAKNTGFKGIGIYRWGVHVDMRPEPFTSWTK